MTRRPPQDLSDLPRMVPDRDDIAQRRGMADPGGNGNGTTGGRKPPRVWPLYFLVLLLGGGLGYLGYEFWLAREDLRETRTALTDARDRVAGLEGQLSETDESLSLNATAIQANFNNILAEIRQLWDVADRRNLDWIRANQEALAELEDAPTRLDSLAETLDSLSTSLSDLESGQSGLTDAQSDLSTQLDALLERSDTQDSQLQTLRADVDRHSSQLDVVSNRAENATEATTDNSQQLNAVEASLISLRAQLENEAATRSDLASTVSSLRAQLDDLEQQQNSLADEVNALRDDSSAAEINALQERVTTIDNARADIIQRLANLQEQLEVVRNANNESDANEPVLQDVEILDNP